MNDTTEINMTRLVRRVPSKGFEMALLPGAPFGPEVVLSLLDREEAGVEVIAAILSPEDKPEHLHLKVGAVEVLLDLHTAGEICDALRFHELSERHAEDLI